MATEQEQNLSELLKACRWLVEAKKLRMGDKAITYGIEQMASLLPKFEKI